MTDNAQTFDIAPEELKARIDRGETVAILDVREPIEWQMANIGGTLIPLSDLQHRWEELEPQKEWFVLCHHGVRSAQVTAFLRNQGFTNIRNIRGGIERWSLMADPSIPRY